MVRDRGGDLDRTTAIYNTIFGHRVTILKLWHDHRCEYQWLTHMSINFALLAKSNDKYRTESFEITFKFSFRVFGQ